MWLYSMDRNYHVFYYLLAGCSDTEKEALLLKRPQDYFYLNQVCVSICTAFWLSNVVLTIMRLRVCDTVNSLHARLLSSPWVIPWSHVKWNYFIIISASRRRPSEIILPEIISKLLQRLIAAREYLPTCLMSLR